LLKTTNKGTNINDDLKMRLEETGRFNEYLQEKTPARTSAEAFANR
jgi:hypothetical protein